MHLKQEKRGMLDEVTVVIWRSFSIRVLGSISYLFEGKEKKGNKKIFESKPNYT